MDTKTQHARNKTKLAFSGAVLAILLGLLASSCTATGTGTPADNNLFFIVLLVGVAAYFYFLIYRPRKKQSEQRKKQIESQKKGDEIVTVGGIYGTIERMDEDTVLLKLESGALMRVARMAIAGKVSDIAPQLQGKR